MLGSKLKELRLSKNMSQRQLADLSGIDRTTIGKYELKNVRPSYEILERICRVLGTTPEYLTSSDSSCTKIKEKPTDLITFIKKANYTLYGSPASSKDKEHISKIIEALYYDDAFRNKKNNGTKLKRRIVK